MRPTNINQPSSTFITSTFGEEKKGEDSSAKIKAAFGIQNFYLMFPYVKYHREIETTKLPQVPIISNDCVTDLKTTLTAIISNDFTVPAPLAGKLYIILLVSDFSKSVAETTYYLGSATPLSKMITGHDPQCDPIFSPEARQDVDNEIKDKMNPRGKTVLQRATQNELGREFEFEHSVLIIVDKNKQLITYKDSYGPNRILPTYQKMFDEFNWQNYTFIESQAVQQHAEDHCFCGTITLENICSSVFGTPDINPLASKDYIGFMQDILEKKYNPILIPLLEAEEEKQRAKEQQKIKIESSIAPLLATLSITNSSSSSSSFSSSSTSSSSSSAIGIPDKSFG